MMRDIKKRVGYLPTTIPSIGLLVLLGYCVHVKPSLLDEPASFAAVVVAVGGLLHKRKDKTKEE
jgi:hypothetical protein